MAGLDPTASLDPALEGELAAAVGGGKAVLLVGDVGSLDEALAERGCRVTTVGWRGTRQAGTTHDVVEDADELARRFDGEWFDVVVFPEALHRLAEPSRALEAARGLLGPRGSVVASFPNAAHGSVRLALLAGDVPAGTSATKPPDSFTGSSATRLFAASGFRVTDRRRIERDPLAGLSASQASRVPHGLLEALRGDPDARTYHYVVRGILEVDSPRLVSEEARESPVMEAVAFMDASRVRLRALGPTTLRIAWKLRGLALRVLPVGSLRRRVVFKVLKIIRGGREPKPTPEAPPDNGIRVRVDPDALSEELEAFLADPDRRLFIPRSDDPVVSILIVTYNNAEHTLRCLSAIADHGGVPLETIVVDNASTDATHDLLDRLDGVTCIRNDENLHFLRGTNRAATEARGRYVLLLNNDAYLEAGALEALVETAGSAEDVGAVGGKLVWPSGRLQEAGSIIWRDGSALGYGRGDDPERSEYRYLREVDYCSAAFLLVRRDLFEEVGGFDARYEPAYYEDSDLCMSLWARGYRVLYDPRAEVVHNEYTSSDPERARDLMQRNRARFEEKWREELSSRPEKAPDAVLRARDRRPGPAILVVDDRVPSPRYGAGLPRMFALVRFLAEEGFRVTVVPMYFSELPRPETDELEGLGVEVLEWPRTGRDVADIRRILTERRGLYDRVLVSRPHSAVLVIPLVRSLAPDAELVYDAEALFYRREEARTRIEGGRTRDVEAVRKVELRLLGAADKVVSVSGEEAALMRSGTGRDDVFIWGPVYDARSTERPFEGRSGLLFVGAFAGGWSPNEEGIRYFVTDVLPAVRERLPDVCLHVVGRSASECVADLEGPGVRIEGFVDDLALAYDARRMFVDPVRHGAGVPLKVAEAMARGIPVVTTPSGARGYGLVDGEHVLVAATTGGFAEKVATLYEDEDLWRKLRDGALEWVERECGTERMRAKLLEILEAPQSPAVRDGTRIRGRHVSRFGMCRARLPRTIWRLPF